MKSFAPLALAAAFGAALILATTAASQTPAPLAPAPVPRTSTQIAHGQDLFNQRCVSCHEPAIEGAPNRADLAEFDPDFIFGVLKRGEMAPMAQGLSDDDLKALVKFLATY